MGLLWKHTVENQETHGGKHGNILWKVRKHTVENQETHSRKSGNTVKELWKTWKNMETL